MANVQKHNSCVNIQTSQTLDLIYACISSGPRIWYSAHTSKRAVPPVRKQCLQNNPGCDAIGCVAIGWANTALLIFGGRGDTDPASMSVCVDEEAGPTV
jgi:hypothetical protein